MILCYYYCFDHIEIWVSKQSIDINFRVLASKFPERLGSIYQLSDEIILALELLIQHHYLSKYSALFAEHFYGIKRTKVATVGPITDFVTNRHGLIKQTLIFHLIIPYIKLKLNRLYNLVKEKYQEPLRPNVKDRFVKLFLYTFPFMHMLLEGTDLIFYMSYAVQKTSYHSLVTFIQGVKLQVLTGDKLSEMEDMDKKGLDELHDSPYIKDKIHYISKLISTNMATTLTAGFEIGAFFLQFLDWW